MFAPVVPRAERSTRQRGALRPDDPPPSPCQKMVDEVLAVSAGSPKEPLACRGVTTDRRDDADGAVVGDALAVVLGVCWGATISGRS
jgi:hypothetical protein